ncbi:hypothetical protein HanRHA438_Chr06g0274771 [Helianthus annuus]|nr:hypothetical protein HanRHA438_Chr06g0274771 [Helianthus annuus]
MAEPSSPHNVEGENPEPSSPVAAEEEEGGNAGGGLPVLKWTKKTFDRLMLDVQMPPEYGAFYPSEGDTGADAPAGYVTLWADFFDFGVVQDPHFSTESVCYIRIRNFESTFRALGIEPTVGDFRRLYQMTVSLGFFSFRQRDGSPKLMTPPKGMTKWKMKFFYIKAAAIVAKMTFRNVTETIIAETIAVPSLKTVEWFPQLQTIESVKLTNTQLWVLRMMLTRRNKKSKPVVREKSGEDAPLWRMFAPDFLGKVETVVCADGDEEFNVLIRENFRVPTEAALAVELPRGKGDLGALGDPDAKGVPKRQTVKGVRFRQNKYRRSLLCLIWCRRRHGLGIAAGSQSGAGKRQVEETAAGAGGPKRRRLQSKRTGPTSKKPADTVELQDKDFSIFDAPLSPPHATGEGASEEPSAPFVKVVPDSTVQTEGTAEKVATQIFDTVDSSNNLISPNEGDNLDCGFLILGSKSLMLSRKKLMLRCGSMMLSRRSLLLVRRVPVRLPVVRVMMGLQFSLGSLNWSIIIAPIPRVEVLFITDPPGLLCRGMIFPTTPLRARRFWVEEAARMRAEAEELIKAARAGAEQLEKDRAAFEKQKQTSEWAATAQLKQVRTLAKLLSDERKSWNEKLSNERRKWNESWAKQNDNLFRTRQELTNAKAANVALGREKAAAEAIAVKAQQAEAGAIKAFEKAKEAGARAAKVLEEAEERESRSSKALEEANAERIRLDKVVASLQAEVQTREVAVTDLTARVTAAEERANTAVEARDALTSSFNQLEADREWMRSHGIARIVQAIMDAPETAVGLDLVKERARDAGFKAGYSRCVSHMNVMSQGGFTAERSGFRDVDTEGRLNAAVAAFYDTSLACVEELDDCLEATDYVDRLRRLYADAEEEDPAGGAGDDAGTSGTK